MKILIRVLVLGALTAVVPPAWGQFSVSDNFSTLSGNWFNEAVTGTGGFSVSVGGTEVLNYLDGGLAANGTSTGSRDWMSNTGGYAQNWQVQVDFTFNLTQVNDQASGWSLCVGNLADLTDNIQGMFQLTTSAGVPSFTVAGLYKTNGAVDFTVPPVQIFNVPSNTVTLQASYLAATHTLSLAYDADGSTNGYSFTGVTSAVVDGGGLGWGMTNSDNFGFRLAAANGAGANATGALTAGQMYADNFAAAATAIPEPSAYAALCGTMVLLAAGWWRRKEQA